VIPFASHRWRYFRERTPGNSLTKKLDKPQDYENGFSSVAPGPKSSGVNKDFSASQAVYVNTARALAGGLYAGPLPGLD